LFFIPCKYSLLVKVDVLLSACINHLPGGDVFGIQQVLFLHQYPVAIAVIQAVGTARHYFAIT
jgi:hypothetical protein